MQFADEAFDILGFTKEEKYNVYKVTSVVMHLGEMKFKKKSAKDDQAAADGTEAGKKIATLLGKIIPFPWDMQALCFQTKLLQNPKIVLSDIVVIK